MRKPPKNGRGRLAQHKHGGRKTRGAILDAHKRRGARADAPKKRAKALTLTLDDKFRCGCGAPADVMIGGDEKIFTFTGACARGCDIAIAYIAAERRYWTTDENGARRIAHIYHEKKSHARR